MKKRKSNIETIVVKQQGGGSCSPQKNMEVSNRTSCCGANANTGEVRLKTSGCC